MTRIRLQTEAERDAADWLLAEATLHFNWLMRVDDAKRERLFNKLYRAAQSAWRIYPNAKVHDIAMFTRRELVHDHRARRIRDLLGSAQVCDLSVWLAEKVKP